MRRVVPLSVFYDSPPSTFQMIALAVGLVTAAVLLLSAVGVHAMMSFTLAQRTREIGTRSALGAQPRHLLLGIFRGAMRQLALGIAAGSLLDRSLAVVGTGVWSASGLLVTVAAIGPARRILRIQTVEALRTEGQRGPGHEHADRRVQAAAGELLLEEPCARRAQRSRPERR